MAVGALLVLDGCGEDFKDPERVSTLAAHVAENPPTDSFSCSDVYAEAVTSVVVVCPYGEPSRLDELLGQVWPGVVDLEVDEDQQAVVTSTKEGVDAYEVMDRKELDLCGDESTSPPLLVALGTRHGVVDEEWSDGGSYPVVHYG